MIKKNEIFNFDAYSRFSKLLYGKNLPFPLNEKTVFKLSEAEKKKPKAITVKSSSLINKKVLQSFPSLRLLITRTVGTNHINLNDLKKLNIDFASIPDYGAFSVAEHVFALLLTLTRKVIFLDKEVRNGRFASKGGQGLTLEGKTFGIIGAGRIGIETIKLAKAFKMKVLAFDMFKNKRLSEKLKFKYADLDKLLKQSDVISLNVPLTKKTKHLISEKEIKQMKKDVILINTSRGGIINTQALINNISKFKYVGLDVLEDEDKFCKKHPLLNYKNVVITPHCAFFTDKSAKIIASRTKKIIKNYFKK
jgi:D-lactate dehydrogenase